VRLIYLTSLYPAYVSQFYGRRPQLELESYETQLAALDADAFGWSGAWPQALKPRGIEVTEILCNVGPLQRGWAWEHDRNLLAGWDLRPIAIEQAKAAKPDVLFFDHGDERMLEEIKREVPGLRLVVGWVGGTIPQSHAWASFDLLLTCAPESVDWMRERGAAAELLQHGFNDAVVPQLKPGPRNTDVGFFGQIVTSGSFHGKRERFLLQLIDAGLPLAIHSPSYDVGVRDDLIGAARIGAWTFAHALTATGLPDSAIRHVPVAGRALRWSQRPSMPLSRKIRPYMREGKFGIDLFNAISSTKVTLNVHADASIRFASNMRLFETAGAGGCLVTDWKDNLPQLFEPDREVVAYRSVEECIEKVRWLIGRPSECEAIAKAAQRRALRDHTYKRRGEQLAAILRGALARHADWGMRLSALILGVMESLVWILERGV
jgi:hypothetical protein